ncbi:MAG TPA: addiction module protein [Kofleriaceae bacterium]|jgi:hypothetical protein
MREPNQKVGNVFDPSCYARDVEKPDARTLIDSLEDGPADPDRDAAWETELDRRSAEVQAGTAKLWTLDELDAYLQQRRAARGR